MNSELEHWLAYWRAQLVDAQKDLQREQLIQSRRILRKRIANYSRWIQRAEAMA